MKTLSVILSAGLALSCLVSCDSAPTGTQFSEADAQSAMDRISAAIETAEASQGPGYPALYSMADDDTQIYLFGTVHLLPEGIDWQTDNFKTAFAEADTLILETDATGPEAALKIQELVAERGMFTDGTTLTSLLSEEDKAVVQTAADSVGAPMAVLDTTQPWFAGLQLGLIQIVKNGYNPNLGVEQILTQEANASGKSFSYLESPEEQINFLSGAPMDDQIEGLIFTARTIESGPELLNRLVSEWKDGDVVGLGAMLGEPTMFGTDQAYQDLIVTRNKNWIPQIEALLDEDGVKFVAVGAGHLSGPDSVIKMLRDNGHTVTLVE